MKAPTILQPISNKNAIIPKKGNKSSATHFYSRKRLYAGESSRNQTLRAMGRQADEPNSSLLSTNENLEQKVLLEEQNDFISTASHEIRTPITTIKLCADIIKNKTRGTKNEVLKDSVLALTEQVDRLLSLTHYLLDATKVQSGRMPLDKTMFSVAALLCEHVHSFNPAFPNHTFTIDCHPDAEAYGDQGRISQVLTNLLSNAIKYSPEGGEIIITVTEDRDTTKITVRDHGLGISSSEQKKLFTQFFRAAETKKNHIAGFGLGLCISQKIVSAHQGVIGLTSTKGKGASFFFTLPKPSSQDGYLKT